MNQKIYPCLWFNNQGKEAADFYCGLFDDTGILQHTPLVTTFQIEGVKFMTLNGGPYFSVNSAISYYVYCGSAQKLSRLYEALKDGGSVLMPLDKYDWSEKYAWVSDRFGVNWQLDIDVINSGQSIVPCMLFANHKMKAVSTARNFYTNIFPDSKMLLEAHYPEGAGVPPDTLLFTQFSLNGFILNAMSSTLQHDFDFTEGNSFVIECESQPEIDHYWDKLTEGGEESMCGWLKDKFGVSWQIVPTALGDLMSDPERGPSVAQALFKMKKIEIGILEAAG